METTEKTILPPKILASLYKNVLISEKDASGITPVNENIPLQAKRLVAVVSTKQKSLPENELGFLSSIMNACKLKKDEYAVLPLQEEEKENYLNIKATFETPFVLLFGSSPSSIDLPIHFPHFQMQHFQGTQYLSAPTLGEIEKDKALKIQLWQSLKQIFA